jgi:hypothetical protein
MSPFELSLDRPPHYAVSCVPLALGLVGRNNGGCDGLAHKFDPTASWARVNWSDVETDLRNLKLLSGLLHVPGLDGDEALGMLQSLTSPKDLLRIMSDGHPGEVLSQRARTQVSLLVISFEV